MVFSATYTIDLQRVTLSLEMTCLLIINMTLLIKIGKWFNFSYILTFGE